MKTMEKSFRNFIFLVGYLWLIKGNHHSYTPTSFKNMSLMETNTSIFKSRQAGGPQCFQTE